MRIVTLGKPRIVGDDGAERAVRGHQAWAVLVRLLLSERRLSRHDIASELFPETVDPLGSLRWCLASLRRSIGSDVLRGDPIELNLPPGAYVDVWNIENDDFDIGGAGELLEGIEPRSSAEFAIWLLMERERTAARIHARTKQEAMRALSVGEFNRSMELAELAVRRQPMDESSHILLVKSLTMAGRHETALEHVQLVEKEFQSKLGELPSPALRSAARQSIAATPQGISRSAVLEAMIDSGLAALSAGAVETGLEHLRRAAADSEKAIDSHLQARSLCELGSALVHSVRGFDDEGAILLRQAAECARQCGSQQVASVALRELGYVEALAGRRPSAARILDEALACSAGDSDSLAGVHAVIAFNLVDWGRHEEGVAHYEQSLDHARRSGNRRREIWTLGIGGWGQLIAGNAETARIWLADCLELCDALRWVSFRPWPLAAIAETELRMQCHSGAVQKTIEEAIALSCQLSDPCWEGAAFRAMGLAEAAKNEFDSAKQWMAQARQRCDRVTDLYAGLSVQILADQMALFVQAGDDPQQVRDLARELLSLAARTHADAHLQTAMQQMGAGR